VKGLLIAAVIHATYNTLVTNLASITGTLNVSTGLGFIAFVILYDGALLWVLYRKLSAYQDAYVRTGASDHEAVDADDEGPGEKTTATEGRGTVSSRSGARRTSPARPPRR